MPIDPSAVKWDESPIDASQVQWDEGTPQPQAAVPAPEEKSLTQKLMQGYLDYGAAAQEARKNFFAGALRGAGSIGATLLAPYDMAKDALAGKGLSLESNRERRAGIDGGLRELGANPDSGFYSVGKLGGEIAGTAGAGPLIAGGAKGIPIVNTAAAPLISSIESGGFAAGGLSGLPALATRVAGGAITGGASAGLVNPEDAGLGAMVGGAIPGVASVVGSGARAVGSALRGGEVAPEVAQLAQKAQQLGIDVPADRIVNSKPMNALAASLEYIPLSGRSATMNTMQKQFNQAAARTIGQSGDNIVDAVRQARLDLGQKFGSVLRDNKVVFDDAFRSDLARIGQEAGDVLEDSQAAVIGKQINQIAGKVKDGVIDGEAAYNIKKTLDTIGAQGTPQSYLAGQLKKSLMDALDRSLGPEKAAEFATTRRQYSNLLALEPKIPNGAEGDLPFYKLGNMRDIRSQELRDLADISAQFLKPRESAHGAAQRVTLGALGAGFSLTNPAALGTVAGLMAGGRGANKALNSQALRNALLSPPSQGSGLLTPIGKTSSKVLPLLVPSLSGQ